ncbi:MULTISPECIES: acyltransferase family protein [Novosphingobium]|uniref:Peptidoglycan/LPS O-acetylase OafA/YrhL, contains acyltransferase and SGNH-hydrolase domains n=1 Tax=Novosphingobium mathurense TaxID=428990 RepID=A0A1U6IB39_9SPHN|nr:MULTISPECIES: acyltransferase [Novosphingobium]CDO34127.1 putative Acyltransferase family protein [Novosphingobium sp. KN65.2]SLK05236.1 Peptidoglycan/LPS O-acetylase OafA/YrhL, contains acyltransferase and SGNH-hydrolase domains [Novosphingobium mathurense]
MDERFLNRPLSVVFDFLRFGAALLVALGHAVQLGLYAGDFPFGVRMQHYCVIVFFVLSGLVISSSVLGGRSDLRRFAISRISRILPVAVPALLFGLLAAYVLAGPAYVPIDNSPNEAAEVAERFIPPLAFVSAWPGMPAPVWNPPYWSLCYEVWYYAIFALAFFLRGRARYVATAVACLAAGPSILLLMPVWLVGVALTHFGLVRRVPIALAPILLVLCPFLALQLFEIDREVLIPFLKSWWPFAIQWSVWAIADLAMALIMVLGILAARPLVTALEPQVMRLAGLAQGLAGFSFTLYLFHWPLIQLLLSHGFGRTESVSEFAALLALVVGTCALISILTERQSPRLRRWIEAKFPARASLPVTILPA